MIRPYGPRVLVRPIVPEPAADAIIEATPNPPTMGEILALGHADCPTCGDDLLRGLAVGMVVLVQPGGFFQEVETGGATRWFVHVRAIVGEVLPEPVEELTHA